jgi:hypothetical protein
LTRYIQIKKASAFGVAKKSHQKMIADGKHLPKMEKQLSLFVGGAIG